jgi:DNA-binding response OmpR family regulator
MLLSAQADEQLKNELLGAGAQDFVTKPFSEDGARNLVEIKCLREITQADVDRLAAQNQTLCELFEQAPGFMAVLRGPDQVFEWPMPFISN